MDSLKNNPHAYVKLWKHHAAQDEANKPNELPKKEEIAFKRYGGKISSEWMIPKIMQILMKHQIFTMKQIDLSKLLIGFRGD